MNTPFKDIPEEGKKAILYGCSEPIQVAYMSGGKARVYEFNFDGVIPTIERRYKETTSDSAKEEYMDYMTSVPCPTTLFISILPPFLSNISFAIESPSPVPPISLVRALSTL